MSLRPHWQAFFVIGALFVATALTPVGALANKPIVLKSAPLTGGSVTVDQPALVIQSENATPPNDRQPQPTPRSSPALNPGLPALAPDWRVVLDRPYYRFQQRFSNVNLDPGRDYISFLTRSTADARGVLLVVSVNGQEVARLSPKLVGSTFRWVQIELPYVAMNSDHGVTVEFQAIGNVDASSGYFLIGGIEKVADGIGSRIWTGSRWKTDDLSDDVGTQKGMALVLFDGRVPPLQPTAVDSTLLLDPSISDRLQLWQTAVLIFRDHPLLGTGFYTFGTVKSAYGSNAVVFAPYANAHSNFFELLADVGILGPILFLLVLVWAAIPVAMICWRRDQDWVYAAALTVLLGLAETSVTQTWLADSRFYISAWSLTLVAAFCANRLQLRLAVAASHADIPQPAAQLRDESVSAAVPQVAEVDERQYDRPQVDDGRQTP